MIQGAFSFSRISYLTDFNANCKIIFSFPLYLCGYWWSNFFFNCIVETKFIKIFKAFHTDQKIFNKYQTILYLVLTFMYQYNSVVVYVQSTIQQDHWMNVFIQNYFQKMCKKMQICTIFMLKLTYKSSR